MKVRTGYYGKIRPGKSVMIKCLIGQKRLIVAPLWLWERAIGELSRTTLDEIRTEIGFLFRECIV
jgi:phospholipid/cholesterol/gamma-HCH transport system ATP-binding protein